MPVSYNRATPSHHPFLGCFPHKPTSYWASPMASHGQRCRATNIVLIIEGDSSLSMTRVRSTKIGVPGAGARQKTWEIPVA